MKGIAALFNRKGLRFPLFLCIFLFLFIPLVAVANGNDEKESSITGYFGFFITSEYEGKNSPLSFHLEYDRRFSRRYSLAASVWYSSLKGYGSAHGVMVDFSQKVGNNFTQIMDGGFILIFEFGCYVYFPRSNKKGEWFLYFGTLFSLSHEMYRMFDNETPLTERASFTEFEYMPLFNIGVGYSHKLSDRYSLRVECRPPFPVPAFRVGLSYRF